MRLTQPGLLGECRTLRDLVPLLVVAGLLGSACWGHFVKPHGDFYGFRETGHALLHGELPPSFKRAPVFPVVVAAAGELLGMALTTETPPDQLAASWINAILLPCNVALVYLIGRRWFGVGARWVALWFVLLPIGLQCTAQVLVEPLLLTLVLLTIWLAQRGSNWAYLAAALASMARYDAAGALVGVALADVLRSRRLRAVAVRSTLAMLPLAIWLALTAATWETRSQDHYLRQIVERWSVDVVWPLRTTLDCVFGPEALTVPVWAAEAEPWLRASVHWAVVCAALLGIGVLLVRRDPAAVGAAIIFVGYSVVHAVFPFRSGFDRFGYLPAALALLAAGMGTRAVATWLAARIRSHGVRGLLVLVGASALLVVVWGEFGRLRALLTTREDWLTGLPVLALAGTGLIWATAWQRWRAVGSKLVVLLALGALTVVQVRLALPMLGSGQERINVVRAARWIRTHTGPLDGVLSDEPGLLRMYAGDRPYDRFVGLGGIAAESWSDILTECRRRGIRYIIWHDQVFQEQGEYYIRKWRLGRFALLSEPEGVTGIAVETRYANRPTLWILRILPEGD